MSFIVKPEGTHPRAKIKYFRKFEPGNGRYHTTGHSFFNRLSLTEKNGRRVNLPGPLFPISLAFELQITKVGKSFVTFRLKIIQVGKTMHIPYSAKAAESARSRTTKHQARRRKRFVEASREAYEQHLGQRQEFGTRTLTAGGQSKPQRTFGLFKSK